MSGMDALRSHPSDAVQSMKYSKAATTLGRAHATPYALRTPTGALPLCRQTASPRRQFARASHSTPGQPAGHTTGGGLAGMVFQSNGGMVVHPDAMAMPPSGTAASCNLQLLKADVPQLAGASGPGPSCPAEGREPSPPSQEEILINKPPISTDTITSSFSHFLGGVCAHCNHPYVNCQSKVPLPIELTNAIMAGSPEAAAGTAGALAVTAASRPSTQPQAVPPAPEPAADEEGEDMLLAIRPTASAEAAVEQAAAAPAVVPAVAPAAGPAAAPVLAAAKVLAEAAAADLGSAAVPAALRDGGGEEAPALTDDCEDEDRAASAKAAGAMLAAELPTAVEEKEGEAVQAEQVQLGQQEEGQQAQQEVVVNGKVLRHWGNEKARWVAVECPGCGARVLSQATINYLVEKCKKGGSVGKNDPHDPRNWPGNEFTGEFMRHHLDVARMAVREPRFYHGRSGSTVTRKRPRE